MPSLRPLFLSSFPSLPFPSLPFFVLFSSPLLSSYFPLLLPFFTFFFFSSFLIIILDRQTDQRIRVSIPAPPFPIAFLSSLYCFLPLSLTLPFSLSLPINHSLLLCFSYIPSLFNLPSPVQFLLPHPPPLPGALFSLSPTHPRPSILPHPPLSLLPCSLPSLSSLSSLGTTVSVS